MSDCPPFPLGPVPVTSAHHDSNLDGHTWTPVVVQRVGICPELNPLFMQPLVMCSHDLLKWNILVRAARYQRSPDSARRP